MFGRSPNEGVAKLLSVAIFASLCGTYRSGARTSFRTDFGNVAALPVFSLGSELPSSIFQTILASLINRFENTTIERDITWDEAWDTVDGLFRKEFGHSIVAAIAFDIEADEKLALAMPTDTPQTRPTY